MSSSEETCPTCGRPVNATKPRRICSKCKKVMGRHDKWTFTEDGCVAHRHCDNPTSYFPKEGVEDVQ